MGDEVTNAGLARADAMRNNAPPRPRAQLGGIRDALDQMAEQSFTDRRGTTIRFTPFGLLLRTGGEDASSTVYSYRHIVSASAVLQQQGPEVSVQVGSTATTIRPETMEDAHNIVEALGEHGR